jgi:hypothetical protein
MNFTLFTRLLVVVLAVAMTLLTAPAVGQTPPTPVVLTAAPLAPVRVVVVLDNSGSMLHRDRIQRARGAVNAWIDALPTTGEVTLEICTASDHVLVLQTVVLRSAADHAVSRRAVDGVQALRATRTSFRSIDQGIAEVVRRDLQPSERFAFVFATDARSDSPRNDLRPADMGNHIIPVGAGVFVVTGGDVPSDQAFTPTTGDHQPTPGTTGQPSDVLGILSGTSVVLTAPPRFDATPATALFSPITGEAPMSSFAVTVTNPARIARTITLDATPLAGLRVDFVPPAITLPGGGSGRVEVRLHSLHRQPVVAPLHLVAATPDGNQISASVPQRIEPRSWGASNLGTLLLAGVALVGVAGALYALGRRRVSIGVPGDPARATSLSAGEWTSLATFAPELALDAGEFGRAWWGGFRVRGGAQPVSVGGRTVLGGKVTPYRVRETVQVGTTSFVLDRGGALPTADFGGLGGGMDAFAPPPGAGLGGFSGGLR